MGRPRLYDSDSAKVQAFRQRLDSSGFVRKEALVKAETVPEITRLAKQHGVPEADVMGGLVEMGLRAWQQACSQGNAVNSPESEGVAAGADAQSANRSVRSLVSSPLFVGAVAGASGAGVAGGSSLIASSTHAPTLIDAGTNNPIVQFFAQRKAAQHATQQSFSEQCPRDIRPGDDRGGD